MSNESSCGSCSDSSCSAQGKNPGEGDREFQERQAIAARMCRIKKKIVVLSGKGGVGKSTVATNVAAALSLAGRKVGLLDIDIHGPSIPKMLHLEGSRVAGNETELYPVETASGLKVMSIGLLMQNKDEAVIWRGPMKYGAIMQFLKDVEWGDLDFLIVDSPPGTGDEPLSVVQLLEKPDGAIIVTTPQDVSVADVRRSIMFCRQLDLPVLGVIENMSGFVCPHCSEHTDIFGSGGGKAMAEEMGVPYLGAIPLDPQVVMSGDSGKPIVEGEAHTETGKAFGRVVRQLLESHLEEAEKNFPATSSEGNMKIAVPVADGVLCMHFGHCEHFAVFEVDAQNKKILDSQKLSPPAHEPGVLPRWLHEQGANLILSGGMGARAQSLFVDNQIKVVIGAPSEAPEKVVQDYLNGDLQTGDNICDH